MRGDLAYLRAHGRSAQRYLRGRSAAQRVDYACLHAEHGELAERARALAESAERVVCVLANAAHAVPSMLALRERLH